MEAHLQKTVDDALEKLRGLEKQVIDTKKFVNDVRALGGMPPMFDVVDGATTAALTTIKSDTFYGQPFATAVTMYLRMRKTQDLGPATVAEIHEALKKGGYQFDAKSDDYARRGIRHSLSKNSATFHRVPNGEFGLLDWYPDVKKRPARQASEAARDDDEKEDGDAGDDDGAPAASPAVPTSPAPKSGMKMLFPPNTKVSSQNKPTKVG